MAEAEKTGCGGVSQTGGQSDFFNAPLSVHPEQAEQEPARFGAGRPKGSRNRTTEDLARLVQQIGGHPVLAMARVAGMSLKEIKQMLGCSRVEAFDRWVDVLDRLAPYVASKMPLAIAVSGKVTTLNMMVPLGDGAQLLGPEGVAVLFDQARQRAIADGFALPAPAEPDESESDDETKG